MKRALGATCSVDSGEADFYVNGSPTLVGDFVLVPKCGMLHAVWLRNDQASDLYIHVFRGATVPPDGQRPDLPPILVPVAQNWALDGGMPAIPLNKPGRAVNAANQAIGAVESFVAIVSTTEATLTRAGVRLFLTATYS